MMRKFTFRVDFSKNGKSRFISHRELMSIIGRALRRADIPVSLSEGFNPRPRISFPTALPIGVSSDAEIVYIHLSEWLAPVEVNRRLDLQLALIFEGKLGDADRQGIKINDVKPIYTSDMPKTFTVEYKIDFNEPFPKNNIQALLNQKEIIIKRQCPDATKTINIRLYIQDIKDGGLRQILLTVNITNQGTVRPEEVTEALGIVGSLKDGSLNIRKIKTTI